MLRARGSAPIPGEAFHHHTETARIDARLSITSEVSSGEPNVAQPVVRLVDMHKSFGNQVVLDGVSLDFTEGKTTVVMGPSGCGKSVMLKHIIGLLKPDSGEVYFDGTRVDTLGDEALQPIRLQIGLVFQMGALFDSMTVEENIAFPLIEHTRLTREERRARIDEALETVDLSGVQQKLPSQLSGGQRKRVAIARALVLRPRVILFDEPTTGLDPIRSDGINELLKKLQKKYGVTNIVVTHDLASARKVADRVVMLLGGKIVADGSYDSLATHPDVRVQHFLTGVYDKADEPDVPESDKNVGIREAKSGR
jgi:phospholipid/cholesterol/gamma-HCH transport system ATP-binding protein